MRLRTFGIAVLLLTVTVSMAAAQPTGQQVVDAVARRTDSIKDYRTDITLDIKGPKISVNKMKVTLYFKKPDKIHIDAQQGMGIIPTGNFFGDPIREMTANAKPTYLRSERRDGIDCHVVQLTPVNGSQMPPTAVWVDKIRNVVVATESKSGTAMKTAWSYAKVDGKHYLPSLITSSMRPPSGEQQADVKLTLKFSNYRVNKGISDKIFVDKNPQQQARPFGHGKRADPDD